MLFQGKQLSLKKCGPKLQAGPPEALGQNEPNSEFNLSPVFHQSERLRLRTIQGVPRSRNGVGQANQGPPRSQSPKPTFPLESGLGVG